MSNADLRKLPPQSLEAEMSILGGILIDNDTINRVLEALNENDFYRESHRKIFQTMMRLSGTSGVGMQSCKLRMLQPTLQKCGS